MKKQELNQIETQRQICGRMVFLHSYSTGRSQAPCRPPFLSFAANKVAVQNLWRAVATSNTPPVSPLLPGEPSLALSRPNLVFKILPIIWASGVPSALLRATSLALRRPFLFPLLSTPAAPRSNAAASAGLIRPRPRPVRSTGYRGCTHGTAPAVSSPSPRRAGERDWRGNSRRFQGDRSPCATPPFFGSGVSLRQPFNSMK